jgi:hypothetical protein
MKRLAWLLLLISTTAFGQTHVTQPFHYFFDEVNTALPLVNHYELKVDAGTPLNIGLPTGTASTIAGQTTFSVLGDPALVTGSHSFLVRACASTSSTVGCADSSPLAFVLDLTALPAPTNLRVQ